jgi:hypothetical protein
MRDSTANHRPDRRAVLQVLGAAGLGVAASPLLSATAHAEQAATAPVTAAIDWNNVARISKTTPTLQVVVNPLIERGSPIHDNVFRALKQLQADFVRFVAWLPYPRLGVAELLPPAGDQTSWDFSLIDPIVEDFEEATRGHSTILNFSIIPEWMWEPEPWSVSNGQLTVKGGDIGLSQAGSVWTDYAFAVDVTPLQTGQIGSTSYAQGGWAVRMDDSDSGYCFLLSNYPYTSPAAPGYIVFLKLTSGNVVAVEPTALPFAITSGDTYHVVTTVSGSTLTVTINGSTVTTVTDSAYGSGKVGFRENTIDTESAVFANVQVTAPDGTVLLADDFSDGLAQWNPPTSVPADPSTIDFGYEQGTQLVVPVQTVADYYRRLVSWYTDGGFTDEYDNFHASGHHYPVPYWEVLNEIDAEHSLSPQLYTQLYDAIVTAIHQVSPRTQFVGLALSNLALSNPGVLDYFTYFLDPANHQPGVPLNMISYHIYIQPGANDTPETYGSDTFSQADAYLARVVQIEAIRKSLAPHVRTTVDETGTLLGTAETQANPAPIPDAYWNWSGAVFAYIFANLALMGIDAVGESQLVGYPGQFPSVSMVDWNTGLPNARYRALQLLIEEIPPGCALVSLASGLPPDTFFGLGVRSGFQRKLLLINKTDGDVLIQLAGLKGAIARIVDQDSAGGPIRTEALTADEFNLSGYGVVVITLS